MKSDYIEMRDDVYCVVNTRISLDSIYFAFQEGVSPETIATECYPDLTLEQVYGAISFILGNQEKVNVYLKKAETEFNAIRKTHNDPAFLKKFVLARRREQVSAL